MESPACRPGIADRLAALIRAATVSEQRAEHAEAFAAFPRILAEAYPLLHARLERLPVEGAGLMFRWRGRTASAPLVLMAHWDVVPAPDGASWEGTGWTVDPFAGTRTVRDGQDAVVGRGALDDKGPLVVVAEAVENLLAAGFTPEHDVWLVFGGDEEVQGADAVHMSAALRAALAEAVPGGTQPWMVLDEGGAVTEAPASFARGRCAMVGLGEKGLLTARLSVTGSGGHASSPKAPTPIARLGRAIARLESRPFPARLNPASRGMVEALAATGSGPLPALLTHAGRAGPAVVRLLAAAGGEMAAMVRTTVAPTRFSAGSADNVLPDGATATVNCRIAPGETPESVAAGLRRRLRDPEVTLTVTDAHGPSPLSPAEGEAFEAVSAAVGTSWPGTTVVPYLLMAATDSRHFHAWCEHVYRFAPLLMDEDQRARIHGEDEWVSVESLERGERFHRSLITARGGEYAASPPDDRASLPDDGISLSGDGRGY